MGSVRVFLVAVVWRWSTLITGVSLSTPLMIWEYGFQGTVPRTWFFIVATITLLVACFFCWREKYEQIERLTAHSNKAAEELSQLRAEGIQDILNMPVSGEDDLERLITKQNEWRDRVVEVLRKHDTSEPIIRSFLYLGVLRVMPFGKKNPIHEQRLQILARQLEVIESLIAQYSSLLGRGAGTGIPS